MLFWLYTGGCGEWKRVTIKSQWLTCEVVKSIQLFARSVFIRAIFSYSQLVQSGFNPI